MEGRLVNHTIMRLAERDGLDANTRDTLQNGVAFVENMFDGLGFCLSKDGDLLSQWRGYADDARGVSVGFDRTYLENLAKAIKGKKIPNFALYKVEYEHSIHEAKIEPIYNELRRLINEGAFKLQGLRTLLDTRTEVEIAEDDRRIANARDELIRKKIELLPHIFALKTPAFKEEQEWRLVSIFMHGTEEDCLYRAAQNRIVSYRAFDLSTSDIPAISEVILGPKHETPEHVVWSMLKQAGFGEVSIRRSEASYR